MISCSQCANQNENIIILTNKKKRKQKKREENPFETKKIQNIKTKIVI